MYLLDSIHIKGLKNIRSTKKLKFLLNISLYTFTENKIINDIEHAPTIENEYCIELVKV